MTASHASPSRVVLFAHEIHDEGGMERATAELIRRAGREYRFTVVACRLDAELRGLVDWKRVAAPRRPLAARLVVFWLVAPLRARRVRRELTHTLGAIVPARADVASVHYCHATAPRDARRAHAGLARRLGRALAACLSLAAERRCYRTGRVRALAAVSPGVAAELESAYPGLRVVVTPNGVDTERFRPDHSDREAMRAREGLGAGDVVALFMGGDWSRKGLDVVITALGRLPGSLPVRLWVVGAGDVKRYRDIAARQGVDGRVTFFGARRDPERFYRAADMFVLPSRYETFCLAAFEAAATGLPLIVTPVHDVGVLVRDGTGGVLVAPDTTEVAEAIGTFARDPARRRADGDVARSRAEGYTWAASARAVTGLYEELLGVST